jgi:predicted DNA-binding protein (UPF0251 family)
MRDIETSVLTLDQFEAMRLCDVEGLDQETAGSRMGVSRGTIQRLVTAGRRTVMAALVRGDAILVNLRAEEVYHEGVHSKQ